MGIGKYLKRSVLIVYCMENIWVYLASMTRQEMSQSREMKIETHVNWLMNHVDIVGDIYKILLNWHASSEELETKFRRLEFRLTELGELARSQFIGNPYFLNILLMKCMDYADEQHESHTAEIWQKLWVNDRLRVFKALTCAPELSASTKSIS